MTATRTRTGVRGQATTETPARVEASPIRQVRINDPDRPGDYRYLRLRWLCPIADCRRPRGEPRRVLNTHHDAAGREIARTMPDVWEMPCRHVRLAHELLTEAAALAAERTTHRAAAVPRPRTPKDEA